jgi:hypothetical protein
VGEITQAKTFLDMRPNLGKVCVYKTVGGEEGRERGLEQGFGPNNKTLNVKTRHLGVFPGGEWGEGESTFTSIFFLSYYVLGTIPSTYLN